MVVNCSYQFTWELREALWRPLYRTFGSAFRGGHLGSQELLAGFARGLGPTNSLRVFRITLHENLWRSLLVRRRYVG